ncbi:hypothetical protein C4F40_15630 [Sphingobacterium sp. Ka21]|uniref:Uncharacterized protein n=2 Tax=Sphingobacterium pedocola TaxID=2082722 RepID=A0ABR9T9Y0_9SPHI|nr:hypothetical protein [Sphingobacterium pedocola]
MSTLSILQEAVDQHVSVEATHLSVAAESVDTLCNQVLSDMSAVYRQCASLDMAAQDANQCYVFLTRIIDKLWGKPHLLQVSGALHDLLCKFEHRYGHYIKSCSTLPLYQQQVLHDEVARRLPDLIDKLHKKSIPHIYLDELDYAMKSLFHPGKIPELHYSHRTYLPRFLGALEAMADDERSKPWTDRFITLLVNLNFNYMGFYNRWESKQNEQFDAANLQGTVHEGLIRLESELKQYGNANQLAYHLDHKPLLEHMWDYLQMQKKRVKHADGNEMQRLYPFIPLRLNGHQSKLFFHAFCAADLFPITRKEDSAKAVATNIRTESGTALTFQSLNRYDRDKLAPHAPFVIRKLKEMTLFLEDDFK